MESRNLQGPGRVVLGSWIDFKKMHLAWIPGPSGECPTVPRLWFRLWHSELPHKSPHLLHIWQRQNQTPQLWPSLNAVKVEWTLRNKLLLPLTNQNLCLTVSTIRPRGFTRFYQSCSDPWPIVHEPAEICSFKRWPGRQGTTRVAPGIFRIKMTQRSWSPRRIERNGQRANEGEGEATLTEGPITMVSNDPNNPKSCAPTPRQKQSCHRESSRKKYSFIFWKR